MDTSTLNNHYLNTKSQKQYRVSPLKNYIVDKIDSNQNIKRLCRYLTKTPLLNKGLAYDGVMTKQPDLIGSLTEFSTDDDYASVKDAVLTPYPFSEDIISEKKISIYVYSPRTSFTTSGGDMVGKHTFIVEIVYPMEYNIIEPFGQERANLIACEILNEFDGIHVNDELRELIGDCQFKVGGDLTNLRLSKAGYMIATVPLVVSFLGMRTDYQEDSY